MLNDIVTLLCVQKIPDGSGYVKEITTQKQVFAEIKSVGRAEYYAAYQVGISVSIIAVLNAGDYNGEAEVEHEGTKYNVIRTYKTSNDYIELTCSTAPPGRGK